MKTIDRAGLDQWANQQRSFALIDVLPEDVETAQKHSVEQMPHEHTHEDFLAQIERLGADKDQPVVLYESSTASMRSLTAAGMLESAGFGNVYQFVGPQSVLHGSGHDSQSR